MRRCISAGAAAEQRTSCKQCRDNPGICAEICDNIDIIDNIDKTVTSNNVSIINNNFSIIIYLLSIWGKCAHHNPEILAEVKVLLGADIRIYIQLDIRYMFTLNLLIPGRVLTCRRGRRQSCGPA